MDEARRPHCLASYHAALNDVPIDMSGSQQGLVRHVHYLDGMLACG